MCCKKIWIYIAGYVTMRTCHSQEIKVKGGRVERKEERTEGEENCHEMAPMFCTFIPGTLT